jgi:nonsense-mediated mRNA decay protein 3
LGRRFCIRCGSEGIDLLDGLCEDCYVEHKLEKLITIPKILNNKYCKICGSIYDSGKWKSPEIYKDPIKDIIYKNLLRKIIVDHNVKELRIEIQKITYDMKGLMRGEVLIEGKLKSKNFSISESIILNLERTLCDKCSKKKSKYYEAIVQLRGKTVGLLDQDKRRLFESLITPEDLMYISDIIEGKEGVDYYFLNKSIAKKLVNRLSTILEVSVKESYYNERIKNGKRNAKLVISVRI